jgi:hypothetical protein
MHMHGWCERFSALSMTDTTKLYERSKRLIDRGMIRRGPKGYGIDLEPEEVARALVAAFIPASGGGSVEQVEKLLAARPFAPSPQGGFVATGEPKTFEAALVEMLSGEIGDIEAVALDGTIPYADVIRRGGAHSYFAHVPSYRKGARVGLGAAITTETMISRTALADLSETLRAGRR